MSSDDLKTQRYFVDDEQYQMIKKVKVYIRIASKKSIKIQLPAEITSFQLKQIIKKKFQIPEEDQLLYLKGTCLNFNADIFLQNSWIVHVINKSQINLPQIGLQLKIPSQISNQQVCSKYSISPTIKVKKFVQDYILSQFQICASQILLVESGRFLKFHLSFVQQNVQNGTTITLIHAKKDKKLKNIAKSIQKPVTDSKELQSQKSNQQNLFVQSISSISKKEQKIIDISPLKKRKTCQVHEKGYKSFRYASHNVENQPNDLSASIRSTRQITTTQNKIIPIGSRQCNCKKQSHDSNQQRFISIQDRKKLQKQIREQNLHKLMLKKQKTQTQKTIIQEGPKTERKTLTKIKSLNILKTGNQTQRKNQRIGNLLMRQNKIKNPQKLIHI